MTPDELRAAADRAGGILMPGTEVRADDLWVVLAAARRLADIQDAWLVEGPAPDYHRLMKRRVRRQWSGLADTIERSLQ